jgi:transposase
MVYQQTQHWLATGVFEAMAHDLRILLVEIAEKSLSPAGIFGSPQLPSGLGSHWQAADRGAASLLIRNAYQRSDTLGHLLGLPTTLEDEQDCDQVACLAAQIHRITGEPVEIAFVDQDSIGERPAEAAGNRRIRLQLVRLPHAKRGFVLLPRQWVVERDFVWMARFRRLARDYEQLPGILADLYLLACNPSFEAARNRTDRGRTISSLA